MDAQQPPYRALGTKTERAKNNARRFGDHGSLTNAKPIRRDGSRRAPALGMLSTGLLAGALLTILMSSGCGLREWVNNGFTVGPNYCKPLAPAASEWIDYHDPRVKSQEADLAEWWHVFKDPSLDALIETAYQQNISLRVAGTRILQARAQRCIAVGELFPQTQEAFGEYSRVAISKKAALTAPFPNTYFSDQAVGFGAAWELDFWGRFRRAIEAADATLDASVENYDDVLVILLSDVATSYTQLRTYQDRLRFAWQNVVSQYNGYHLAADKFTVGTATERDVQQAKQILEQTRAQVPQLESGIRQANNQLCILLGMPPHELTEVEVGTYERQLMPLKDVIAERVQKIDGIVSEYLRNRQRPNRALPGLVDRQQDAKNASLLKPLEDRQRTPVAPSEVVVGVPADLLRRRPDVRRVEREVKAQSARIGVATSDFYPRFVIIGLIGTEAEHIGDLFSPGSLIAAITPSVQWPILNYGRIHNNVKYQEQVFQQLAFTYQNVVLEAGKEAENGIVGFLKAQEQTQNLNASVNAAARTVEISFDQYHNGVIDFTPLVLFESTLAGQQDSLAVARGNIALNLIETYRALGGGWEMRLAREGVVGGAPAAAPPESAPAPRIAPPPPAPPPSVEPATSAANEAEPTVAHFDVIDRAPQSGR